MRCSLAVLALSASLLASCTKPPAPSPLSSAPSSGAAPTPPSGSSVRPLAAPAEIGKPAPDFELVDLGGKSVRLSSFRGKIVVLEWFNPGCPFVKASHTKGSLRTAARDAAQKGVVWLAVNSSSEGKQGFGVEANLAGSKAFGLGHPVLLDPRGEIGRAYGATNTPHLYVVDEAGLLVYRGAVDNSPDGEGESPTGGKLVSYVEAALGDLAAGRPVATPSTKAYGCGVKY